VKLPFGAGEFIARLAGQGRAQGQTEADEVSGPVRMEGDDLDQAAVAAGEATGQVEGRTIAGAARGDRDQMFEGHGSLPFAADCASRRVGELIPSKAAGTFLLSGV